jgi:hypothetical protein
METVATESSWSQLTYACRQTLRGFGAYDDALAVMPSPAAFISTVGSYHEAHLQVFDHSQALAQ